MNPTSKILNFNKLVRNVYVKMFLDDRSSLPCDFTGSLFPDKNHNHILMVIEKLLTKTKFRKFFSKGPVNQENRTADNQKTNENTITSNSFNHGVINMVLPYNISCMEKSFHICNS